MKSLLLFVLLACGLQAAGQVSPMKQANVVVVQTPDSAAVALRTLAGIFVSQGYTVEKLDKEFLTLTLNPKLIENRYTPVLSVRAAASAGAASALRIAGDYRATIVGVELHEKVFYTGYEKSCVGSCFREMQKAAIAYPSGKVSYAKQ